MQRRFLAILAVLSCLATPSRADGPLAFGVLNQQSPAKTAEKWNPILQYLAAATGLSFQLKMGATVQETDAMMGRGEFDLVYTNHNFLPQYDGIYRVIAKWSEKPIYGVIAVNADSSVRTLRDLAGKRIVFPSRSALVAYTVPAAALKEAGVAYEAVYAAHQEGALAQLRARQVDAAAVNSAFLTRYAAEKGFAYREVFVSEAYADLAVVVHPRLPKAQAEAIRNALLAMKTDPRAAGALQAAQFDGFAPATERDYDNVRRAYKVLGQ